ncbi:cytochrome aa3 quinol oxidase subunit IV [Metabacillus malikii]|uniref:Quinol oxidase subunit 4 n=1 Tax=Metabacillus malikii TaxID=1504265 RepID=A0ABT9ZEV0_9BACI|nr:cytochrome aa3 quinol oxidase subunit IV [Metabacillus malikii]MDQ0230759.1 cytochrome aa3-600 menaquinol oxidase subunit 4 [Metabacillus malikii]
MSSKTNNHHFPWSQLIGFILSVGLTFLAVYLGLHAGLAINIVIVMVFVLAFLQAAIQLFMFMHVTEGEGRWQVGKMLSATLIAIIIVVGSVWVMTSMH